MRLHGRGADLVALLRIVVGIERVDELDRLVFFVLGDELVQRLLLRDEVGDRRRGRYPDRLAALGRVGEGAFQHGLGLDLEGRHVDEEVAAGLGHVGVEGDDHGAPLSRLAEGRHRSVDVEGGRDDAVRALRDDVLVDLDLALDVGGGGADVDLLGTQLLAGLLAARSGQLEENEARELGHVEDPQRRCCGASADHEPVDASAAAIVGRAAPVASMR